MYYILDIIMLNINIYKQSLCCDDNPAVGEAGWRALATALPHLQVRFLLT